MSRLSVKISGMQGQGINSIGEVLAKGFKRKGYCVFGYREYMSLIKGGHSSYQLDVSADEINSSEKPVDIMVCMNYYGLKYDLRDVKPGGILIHRTPQWKFTDPKDVAFIKRNKIKVVYVNLEKILKELKAIPILGNVVITAMMWDLLGQDIKELKKLIRAQFAHKKHLIKMNMDSIDAGLKVKKELIPEEIITLPKPKAKWQKHLLITGSQAMGLGTIHAGCRMYVGYPMTPASGLLSYIAAMQNKTGMVIKQAEDEITAAQMMVGAMHVGCRAATGTAGGGIDLMSETLSVTGIIENPAVFVLAQRAGPGTGIPTWTGQGDLNIAIHAGHGEFPRCVVSASDSQDCFDLMSEVFNIAETFQLPVIIMTDKHIAESLWTQVPYDQNKAKMERGLVTSKAELAKLTGMDRYDPHAKDGISKRWLPGTEAATYCAQGDEHNGDGSVNETSPNAIEQMNKRMKKMIALKKKLPEPELFGHKQPDYLLVGWGSSKGTILDVLKQPELANKKIGYLHYTYMWPLKTAKFERLAKAAKKVIAIEGNYQGELTMHLQMEAGMKINDRIFKYDGRPFFLSELTSLLSKQIAKK